MADSERLASRFLTELRLEDGVLRARVFEAGQAGAVALLAYVPTELGRAALRELLRVAIEGGLNRGADD